MVSKVNLAVLRKERKIIRETNAMTLKTAHIISTKQTNIPSPEKVFSAEIGFFLSFHFLSVPE
jgi:hypothetical protein